MTPSGALTFGLEVKGLWGLCGKAEQLYVLLTQLSHTHTHVQAHTHMYRHTQGPLSIPCRSSVNRLVEKHMENVARGRVACGRPTGRISGQDKRRRRCGLVHTPGRVDVVPPGHR